MGGIRLKKYIGRTLNLKNRISANLYIFDSPEETWENENLNKLDIGLKKTFDLQARFRTIQEGLEHREGEYGIVPGSFTEPKQQHPGMGCHHTHIGRSHQHLHQEPKSEYYNKMIKNF